MELAIQNQMKQLSYFSGTSGLSVPIPMAQYPPKYQGRSRLAFYASLLNSIEINSSFYKIPKASTVAKWAADVPGNFRFTFKLPKQISHAEELVYEPNDVVAFMEAVSAAGDKKGCLLIQFAPSRQVEVLNQLCYLIEDIADADPLKQWQVAVECRHTSWYISEVYETLRSYGAILVMQDFPKSKTPLDIEQRAYYLRFHGEDGRYRGSYDEKDLHRYATQVNKWMKEGKPVWCYFNNTAGGAFEDVRRLNDLVNAIIP